MDAIETLRQETPGISDQLLESFTIVDTAGRPIGTVEDGDSVILFNFRGDRSIELARAFTEGNEFTGFDRSRIPDVFFAAMTLYDGDTNMPPRRLVEPEPIAETVSEYLAASGISQFACSETQKFGHVTYFWNGNRSEPFDPESEVYQYTYNSNNLPITQTRDNYYNGVYENTISSVKYYYQGDVIP